MPFVLMSLLLSSNHNTYFCIYISEAYCLRNKLNLCLITEGLFRRLKMTVYASLGWLLLSSVWDLRPHTLQAAVATVSERKRKRNSLCILQPFPFWVILALQQQQQLEAVSIATWISAADWAPRTVHLEIYPHRKEKAEIKYYKLIL